MDFHKKGWWNDTFLLSTFEAVGHIPVQNHEEYIRRLTLTRDAGYDLVEITWKNIEQTQAILEACEELNIPVILENPYVTGRVIPKIEERDVASVKNGLERYGKYKCIASYYLWDEPMIEDLDTCKELAQTLQNLDDSKLPFFALVPSYGPYNYENGLYPKYIEQYIEKIKPKVLSFDYYCFWQHCIKNPLFRNPIWQDMGIWRRKSIEHNLPFWWYFQGINFGPDVPYEDAHKVITVEHFAVQMYAALAYGVKQLSCYNSFGSIIDTEGNKTHLYDDVKKLNTKVKNIGYTLFNMQRKQMYHTGLEDEYVELYYLDNIKEDDLILEATEELIIGTFLQGEKTYYMVVNKDYKNSVSAIIKLKKQSLCQYFDAYENRWTEAKPTEEVLFKLAAGEGKLISLFCEEI